MRHWEQGHAFLRAPHARAQARCTTQPGCVRVPSAKQRNGRARARRRAQCAHLCHTLRTKGIILIRLCDAIWGPTCWTSSTEVRPGTAELFGVKLTAAAATAAAAAASKDMSAERVSVATEDRYKED